MADEQRINAEAIKRLNAVLEKHAGAIGFDALRDLAKALGLRLRVEIIDRGGGGDGT